MEVPQADPCQDGHIGGGLACPDAQPVAGREAAMAAHSGVVDVDLLVVKVVVLEPSWESGRA